MSLTEKEAKEKLCPFAISGSWIAHNMNGVGAYHCDASDCMAWEWDDKFGEDNENWTGYCHLIFRPCGGAE